MLARVHLAYNTYCIDQAHQLCPSLPQIRLLHRQIHNLKHELLSVLPVCTVSAAFPAACNRAALHARLGAFACNRAAKTPKITLTRRSK